MYVVSIEGIWEQCEKLATFLDVTLPIIPSIYVNEPKIQNKKIICLHHVVL